MCVPHVYTRGCPKDDADKKSLAHVGHIHSSDDAHGAFSEIHLRDFPPGSVLILRTSIGDAATALGSVRSMLASAAAKLDSALQSVDLCALGTLLFRPTQCQL